MSNSITILSDLGTRDSSVAGIKAVLDQYAPGNPIVDISHNVAQYDLQQGAYLLVSAYKHFPPGTTHLLAVDVFAGGKPRLLLAEKNGHFFIAPDNGILALVFGDELDSARFCFEFAHPFSFAEWINRSGVVIKTILAGGAGSFSTCKIKNGAYLLQHRAMAGSIDCNINYVDRFGNIVLDINKAQFEQLIKGKSFSIKMMRSKDITSLSNNYNDVPEGAPLCRFNDAGLLEIALNHAPAATLLGLGDNNSGNLRYHTIKIFF